jgi:hypothetical protein
MPVQIRTLKVRPNPWIHIDSRGVPMGRVAYEQPAGGYDARTVGSSPKNVQKIQDAPAGVQLGQPIHTFEVDYSAEDVLVPNTNYYRRRIMKGELIASDAATYVAAGGSAKGFEEQGKLLDQIKADAIAAFDAENGEGAFDTLEKRRAEDAKLAEKVKLAAAADQEPKLLKKEEPERAVESLEARADKSAKATAAATKGDS